KPQRSRPPVLRGARRLDRRRPNRERPRVCGRPELHPYELLLSLEGIEHRTTRVHTPQTNGFVERMNRTLLDESFRIAGRTTRMESTPAAHGVASLQEHPQLRFQCLPELDLFGEEQIEDP